MIELDGSLTGEVTSTAAATAQQQGHAGWRQRTARARAELR
jgi:hypothetical protein